MNFIPVVVEQENFGERSYDIYSKLLKNRIVFLSGKIYFILSNFVVD